ncbi:hypothetical protein IE53DRAFT_384301 [Violaceomyces palustris]|uniref:Uncharacterized protein n=1 Tax=Violaceomyces palustris TaxID=1673888 RepID=A0ACD0P5B0_9BASI|nr:hypothetical protein IE53DRAFT_384301 [Violaceomyces palustris]
MDHHLPSPSPSLDSLDDQSSLKAYSDQLRDILGSDVDDSDTGHASGPEHQNHRPDGRGLNHDEGDEGEDGEDREDEDEEGTFIYPRPNNDQSIDTDPGLPDVSFTQEQQAPAHSSSSQIPKGTEDSNLDRTSSRSVSQPTMNGLPLSSSFTSSITASSLSSSTPFRSMRPAAYPSISRLRSQALPRSSSNPSSLARIRSPSLLGSSFAASASPASFSLGTNGAYPTTPSFRSRSSSLSLSSSLGAAARIKYKNSFPYGASPSDFTSAANTRGDFGLVSELSSSIRLSSEELDDSKGKQSRQDGLSLEDEVAKVVGGVEKGGTMYRNFFRWSALRKISKLIYPTPPDLAGQVNGQGSAAYINVDNVRAPDGTTIGEPKVMAVAGGLVAVGMSKGWTVVFEFNQEIRCICGTDELAREGGQVTAVSFSSNHSFIGVGHASGHVALYDLAKPFKPARLVAPVTMDSVVSGKREGHLPSSKILHLSFVGLRTTAIVTADDSGLVFYHALGKILGVPSNDTLRLLGRYPEHRRLPHGGFEIVQGKRSTVYAMMPLPLGPTPHMTDEHNFIAILTPSKLVIVALKPSARTWYRRMAPKRKSASTRHASATNHQQTSESRKEWTQGDERDNNSTCDGPGALAWFPSTMSDEDSPRLLHPLLAYSFGSQLFLLRLNTKKAATPAAAVQPSHGSGRSSQVGPITSHEELDFIEEKGLTDDEQERGEMEGNCIVALQWVSHELLLVVTGRNLSLFDLRVRRLTERQDLAPWLGKVISHPWFDAHFSSNQQGGKSSPGGTVKTNARHGPALSHSIRAHKGKIFFLTSTSIVVGTLLSWADRILNFVSVGDFLSAIELGILYHQGQGLGSAIGLPVSREDQKAIIGKKLKELMVASIEYAFSPDRLTDATHVTEDGRGVDRTPLFENLARICAKVCLNLGEIDFLFRVVYDKYEENGIEGIFVEQMERFIVEGQISKLPIPVVQRLVSFRKKQGDFDLAERIIWHVDPACLDLDQALSLCLERGLYDAMIHVYNRALKDYVTPIIQLLDPVKKSLKRRDARASSRRLDETGREAGAYPFLQDPEEFAEEEQDLLDSYKIFSYMSVILSGHYYPSQDRMQDEKESKMAKTTIYNFVFSGRCVIWPKGAGGKLIMSVDDGEQAQEPTFPYLKLLLSFDSEAFLDVLDLVFEDDYLDEDDEDGEEDGDAQRERWNWNDEGGKRFNRQIIIDILLEICIDALESERGGKVDRDARLDEGTRPNSKFRDQVSPFQDSATTFLSIFVARNVAKYPQFVRIDSEKVNALLQALIQSRDETTREDRQLAMEYLLSHHKILHSEERLKSLEQAGFLRILEKVFRSQGNWDKLLKLFLRDLNDDDDEGSGGGGGGGVAAFSSEDEAGIFSKVHEVLFKVWSHDAEKAKFKDRLNEILMHSIVKLFKIDSFKTWELIQTFSPEKHAGVVRILGGIGANDEIAFDEGKRLQLVYLGFFYQPDQSQNAVLPPADQDPGLRKLYISLLIKVEPGEVVRNLDSKSQGFYDLDLILEESEEQGLGDCQLWCLDKQARTEEIFDRLDRYVSDASLRILSLSSNPLSTSFLRRGQLGLDEKDVKEMEMNNVRGAVSMAVRICCEKTRRMEKERAEGVERANGQDSAGPLDTGEMWYRLLRCLVDLVYSFSSYSTTTSNTSTRSYSRPSDEQAKTDDEPTTTLDLVSISREIIEDTLSSLVSSTTAESVSFPSLFKKLVSSGNRDQHHYHQDGMDTHGSKSTRYQEVRSVLEGMISAYKLRTDLLGIANRLFDRDTFDRFKALNSKRKRGWRGFATAQGETCSGCGTIILMSQDGAIKGMIGDLAHGFSGVGGDLASSTPPLIPSSPEGVDLQTLGRNGDILEFGSDRKVGLYRRPEARIAERDFGRDGAKSRGSDLLRRRAMSPRLINLPSTRRPRSPYLDKSVPVSPFPTKPDKGKGALRGESDDFFSWLNRDSHVGTSSYFNESDGPSAGGGDGLKGRGKALAASDPQDYFVDDFFKAKVFMERADAVGHDRLEHQEGFRGGGGGGFSIKEKVKTRQEVNGEERGEGGYRIGSLASDEDERRPVGVNFGADSSKYDESESVKRRRPHTLEEMNRSGIILMGDGRKYHKICFLDSRGARVEA